MLLEKLFGNTWGYIWLILFIVVILALLVFILVKKDKVSETGNEKEEIINNKEESKKEIKEKVERLEKEEVTKEVKEEKKEKSKKKDYGEFEIVTSEDGFFRVKKINSERALRKFSTLIEAENYIEKRGLSND